MPNDKNYITREEYNALKEELDAIKQTLSTHRHLGTDGSEEFKDETEYKGKRIRLTGAGAQVGDFVKAPIIINDQTDQTNNRQRATSLGIALNGEKDTISETVEAIIGVGKDYPDEKGTIPTTRTDFNEFNQMEQHIYMAPQVGPILSGPSILSRYAFQFAFATPVVGNSSGSLTSGGNTFTDSSASFAVDALAYSYLVLNDSGETHRILTNTSNVITIDGTWSVDNGSYAYTVITPVMLGNAVAPYSRLYVGEDMRLGYGASDGTQVQYIKWGNGSPEGVVTASRGSLYLRKDGGVNTTLYVKEAGDGLSTGWSAI